MTTNGCVEVLSLDTNIDAIMLANVITYSVHVELALQKPLITYEYKQLWSYGLHHWKELGEAASKLEAQPVYSVGKFCFKFLYKSLQKKHNITA